MDINKKLDNNESLDKFENDAHMICELLDIKRPYDITKFDNVRLFMQKQYDRSIKRYGRSRDYHRVEHLKFYKQTRLLHKTVEKRNRQVNRLRDTIRVWKMELQNQGLWDNFIAVVRAHHPKEDGVLAGMRKNPNSKDGF